MVTITPVYTPLHGKGVDMLYKFDFIYNEDRDSVDIVTLEGRTVFTIGSRSIDILGLREKGSVLDFKLTIYSNYKRQIDQYFG